ncbi:DUF3011 domain-containing protein [Phyllobacterium zundukense]|uniref:DUF3011 domain-containing protein n=1 Tax=Phyllobacterium zundukense TaxID=1867719 RepID=A0A2N9VX59_9HYPH|nr:hypothetical protein BLM14_00635 [Phyllobacterium zundukense]PIO44077.1 hypothetical protein B5P45_16110 [Phyllobacterium zundukense]
MYRYILAFAIALGGAQFISEPAQAQNAVKCESRKFKYRECDTDMRRPRITRQLSKSPCIAGDTWGFQRGTIWVDRGCAAVFADSGGRPRWRDRDSGWDDRYPPRGGDDYYPRRRRNDGVEFELDF